MSHYLIEQIAALPNVDVRTGTLGDRGATARTAGCGALRVARTATATSTTLDADACFVFIGAVAAHRLARRASSRATSAASSSPAPTSATTAGRCKRDPYLLETSVPGVFVAGDVRARSIKRVASAVGEGSMAVSLIHQYLVEA